MSVLPDHVCHGGTYAGNRVAAAAAVATLRILRDTDALAAHPPGRARGPGRAVRGHLGARAAVRLHRPPGDVRDHVPEEAPTEYRDWATSDHDLYDAVAMGMQVRGAMPEPDSREPWFFCEAHAREDIVDRVVTIFAESLAAALEARARGETREIEASQWSMSSGADQPGPAGAGA